MGGQEETIALNGLTIVRVEFDGPQEGDASDDDSNQRDEVYAEIIQMELNGTSSFVGPVIVRQSGPGPSPGMIEETTNVNPGWLDVDPFTSGYTADSFFDVFFEIEVQSQGMILHTAQPVRMEATISHKPPAPGDDYNNPSPTPTELLDGNNQPTGIFIRDEIHVPVPVDWGDAPDPTYPTLAANNGANHLIVPGFQLGRLIDSEGNGIPDANALGDDNNNLADEDGVTFDTPLMPGLSADITVTAGPAGGNLDAWLDFNDDGDWDDAGEQIFGAPLTSLNPGPNSLTFNVPAGAIETEQTFARFRLTHNGGFAYNGTASEGEVEDYEVSIIECDQGGDQDIIIDNRWQWVSAHVDPLYPDMSDIWLPLGCVDFVLDHNWGFWTTIYPYDPSNPWNGIGNWENERMYIAHANCNPAATLTLNGCLVDPDEPIELTQGWNWVAYYPDFQLNGTTALSSIVGNLIIAYGYYGFYIPVFGIDFLSIDPGDGLILLVNADCTLTYPATPPPQLTVAPHESELSTLEHFSYVETDHYYPVVFIDQEFNLPFAAGDEIGLFAEDDGQLFCIGAAEWSGELPFALRGWADNPLTEAKDGYEIGEPIVLRAWSAQDDLEYELDVAFMEDASTYETANYTIADLTALAIDDEETTGQGFGLEQNNPNPFKPLTTIRYRIAEAGKVRLSIFNASGRLIRTLVDTDQQPGRYSVDWNAKNDLQQSVTSGIYFYRLQTNGKSETKKMVLLK